MKGLLRIVLAAAMALGAASPVRAADPQGEVTGVSLQPAPGRAEIIIAVSGAWLRASMGKDFIPQSMIL